MTDSPKAPVIALEEHYMDPLVAADRGTARRPWPEYVASGLADLGELRLREMDEAGMQLADLDAMLHGAQPGLVLHKLLPEVLEWPLTLVYGPLWAVVWVGGFFAVAVYGDRQLRRRYWWTCALSLFGLGTVLATALSSVGPIYYEAVYGDPRYRPSPWLRRRGALGLSLLHEEE